MYRWGPNMNPLTVTLSRNIDWLVYDEIWCLKFARWPCKKGNYWHATDSYTTCLWFGRERIKRYPCVQKLVASIFYGLGKIRKCYGQWKFYGGEQIRKDSKSINKNKEKYAIDETEHE